MKRILEEEKFFWTKQEVAIMVGEYTPPRMAIQLWCVDEGLVTEPWMMVTVNLPEHPCPDGEVWIKDYSENTGAEFWLIKNGIIKEEVLGVAQSGFVQIRRFALTDKVLRAL